MRLTLLLLFISGILNLEAQTTTIAVLELDAYGISKYESLTLTDRLRNELFKTKRFRVIERDKMNEILDEQGFQQSGCVSSECLVEVGRLLGVSRMIGGSIGRVGNTYSVSVRIINVETGEVIKTASKDYQGAIDNLLVYIIPEIAREIAGIPSYKTEYSTEQKKITTKSEASESPLFLISIGLGNSKNTSSFAWSLGLGGGGDAGRISGILGGSIDEFGILRLQYEYPISLGKSMKLLPLIGLGYYTDFWQVKEYNPYLDEYENVEHATRTFGVSTGLAFEFFINNKFWKIGYDANIGISKQLLTGALFLTIGFN